VPSPSFSKGGTLICFFLDIRAIILKNIIVLFTVNRVIDEKELAEVYKLRYKVYCEEWGFEKPEDYPDGLEKDIYDNHSLHFAAKDNTGKVIGTVRLILDSIEGFPIEKHSQLNIKTDELPRESLAEISRLAISKEHRRRAEDAYIYGHSVDKKSIDRHKDGSGASPSGSLQFMDKRKKHEIIFRLYSTLYKECKHYGITHCYAIMGRGLYVLIRRYGIRFFRPIGDPVNYHGVRTPYLGEIRKLELEDFAKNQELREEFSRYL
jgi:N-acyl amino acid synthase of PEP-CTERM/exosortase system